MPAVNPYWTPQGRPLASMMLSASTLSDIPFHTIQVSTLSILRPSHPSNHPRTHPYIHPPIRLLACPPHQSPWAPTHPPTHPIASSISQSLEISHCVCLLVTPNIDCAGNFWWVTGRHWLRLPESINKRYLEPGGSRAACSLLVICMHLTRKCFSASGNILMAGSMCAYQRCSFFQGSRDMQSSGRRIKVRTSSLSASVYIRLNHHVLHET